MCGGLATRLGTLVTDKPKSLIPIAGEPFLAHQLRLLHANGVRRAVLCVGHLGALIEEFVGNGTQFGIEVSYSWDGPRALGTGGAVRNALAALDETFFVLYGDSYLPCDYAEVARAFEQSGRLALMTIYRNEGQFDTSNVEATDGRILRYDKRDGTATMQFIDYGLGVFHRSVFEQIPEGVAIDLATVYQDLLARSELAGYEVHERFYEIGSFEGIRDLEEYLS